MRKIAIPILAILLLAVIFLQVLAALHIFPNCARVEICPVEAISMKSGKAYIDAQKCIGCRRCVAGIEVARTSPEQAPQPQLALAKPETQDVSEPQTAARKQALPSKEILPPAQQGKPVETELPLAFYAVDPEKCIGCGLCTIYCPERAISMIGDKAVIDKDKCTNCGICKEGNKVDYAGCPVSAISAP